jgi:hypothetical protein
MNITTIYKLHKLEIIYKSYQKDPGIVWLGLGWRNMNLKLIKLNNV